MFRRRSLRTAVAAIAGAATTSQVYTASETPHVCTNGRPLTLSVPLEFSLSPALSLSLPSSWNAPGETGHGVLHRSRTLLSPHGAAAPPSGRPSAPAKVEQESRGPYDVSIDEALLGSESANPAATPAQKKATVMTVRDLVCLLVDPDAASSIEAVSLRDFAAMAPRRQLRAVNNDHDCLGILLHSERYQSEKDARALRLVGVTTVGQWREQPDRVPLSAYGRGVLETVYNSLARNRQQSQKDFVLAWLTRTIQRAVAEELMAPKMLSSGVGESHTPTQALSRSFTTTGSGGEKKTVTPPLLMHADAGEDKEADMAYTTTFAPPDRGVSEKAKTPTVEEDLDNDNHNNNEAVESEDDDLSVSSAARRRGLRQRSVMSPADKATAKAAAARADAIDAAAEEIMEEVGAERGEEIEEDVAELMAEAEAILKHDGSQSPAAAAKPESFTKEFASAAVNAEHAKGNDAPEEEEVEEVEEVVEEVVEEEEETPEDVVKTPAPVPAHAATTTAPPPTPSATTALQKEKLARLAELMLKQFNTADGYLHPTNKAERQEQEQRGDILVLDEDTAQVDPLAMFSAYHAATVTEADPISVRALKTIWTSYNKHQVALEEAGDEAAAEFYKHESINALLYGSVLMRALAREEPVVVLESASLPHYGFPLVSSDTRPFSATTSSSSSLIVTDMTPGKVPTAMQAYKILFSDREKRYSPFRPAIDHNAGCSVVRLSGTTLHLYYTSTKDHIIEEEVRLPFAEVLLGMLHLLRQKVLPRVNVIHYHLIATRLAEETADTDFMLRSTATLDLTNPFTKEEHATLKALAAPLGMSEEMDEFRCIDDLVMEIEDNSGASVVHSLLHNREDLEATLTATLAQLLPEEVEGEAGGKQSAETEGAAEGKEEIEEVEVAEDEEQEVDAPPPRPLPTAPTRKGKATAAAVAAQSAVPTADIMEIDDDADEEIALVEEDEEGDLAAADEDEDEELEAVVEEDEEAVETMVSAAASSQPVTSGRSTSQSSKKPLPRPVLPVLPTTRRSAAEEESVDDEEAELEKAIYTQWQKQREQQQQHHRVGGVNATSSVCAAEALEAEDEEEFEEDEEEEVKAPATVATAAARVRMTRSSAHQHQRSVAPTSTAAASPSRRHGAPPLRTTTAAVDVAAEDDEEVIEEVEEDEEDEGDMEVVTAPVLPRSPAGRRAVPVEAMEEEEEEEHVAVRSPMPPPPQRGVRRQSPAAPVAAAVAVPSGARASPPPRLAAEMMEEDASVDHEDEEGVPPPLPEVRTRRGGSRRRSARVRVPIQLEQEVRRANVSDDGSIESSEATAVENEDQWFKRPKRRYVQ